MTTAPRTDNIQPTPGPAILRRVRRAVRGWRVRRTHEAMWGAATSVDELRELMARFCLGELECWPSHLGPRDPETVSIGPVLAHANRAGFLTTSSQPGYGPANTTPAGSSSLWEQRAAVDGLCAPALAQRLAAVVAGTRLRIQATTVDGVRRTEYRTAVDVTRIGGAVHTRFGATLSARDITFEWSGIRSDLITTLSGMHQVLIYDPMWGEERLLWERLAHL